jgi:hypothetical protein
MCTLGVKTKGTGPEGVLLLHAWLVSYIASTLGIFTLGVFVSFCSIWTVDPKRIRQHVGYDISRGPHSLRVGSTSYNCTCGNSIILAHLRRGLWHILIHEFQLTPLSAL